MSEWLVVENAHPAIITEEETKAIAVSRRSQTQKRFDTGYGRSRHSPYLLTGGMFRCGRCGANMAGMRTSSGRYYVCGSRPNRRGLGCGQGVYVPQGEVEANVIDGLRELLAVCTDAEGFTRRVNEELRKIWEKSVGYDPQAACRLESVDAKIANIRRAIEDGLADAEWANDRLGELLDERQKLTAADAVSGDPPRIDIETALSYRRQVERLFVQGEVSERKRLLRAWVQEVELDPTELGVRIAYRVPESVMHGVVAGAGFEPATSGL